MKPGGCQGPGTLGGFWRLLLRDDLLLPPRRFLSLGDSSSSDERSHVQVKQPPLQRCCPDAHRQALHSLRVPGTSALMQAETRRSRPWQVRDGSLPPSHSSG